MRLKDIVRAKKTITDTGKQGTGKMKDGSFPMSKTNALKLGTGWVWQVIQFTAHCNGQDVPCRLLVALHPGKSNYLSFLGVQRAQDTVLIARCEFHMLHKFPGWHVHTKCDEIATLAAGCVKGPNVKRFPDANVPHRRSKLGVTETDFLAPALKKFRIELGTGLS